MAAWEHSTAIDPAKVEAMPEQFGGHTSNSHLQLKLSSGSEHFEDGVNAAEAGFRFCAPVLEAPT